MGISTYPRTRFFGNHLGSSVGANCGTGIRGLALASEDIEACAGRATR